MLFLKTRMEKSIRSVSYTHLDVYKRQLVLGYKPGNTDVTSGDLELAGYKSLFEQMVADYNFDYCISSLRVSHSASDNGWSACILSLIHI